LLEQRDGGISPAFLSRPSVNATEPLDPVEVQPQEYDLVQVPLIDRLA
jgi:hypothetical protein